MGKCVHYTPDGTFTLCGVNLVEKPGARGSQDPDEASCNNCLKLLHGGQMGAPPPSPKTSSITPTRTQEEKAPVDLALAALRNNLVLMESMSSRLHSMEIDLRVCLSYVPDEYVLENLTAFQEYVDAAHERLKWAKHSLRRCIDGEESGELEQ